jgi:hypothetical protein
VQRVRAALRAAQEGGPALSGHRARGQHGLDLTRAHDAARRDLRQRGDRGDLADQREQAAVTPGRVVVHERPPVRASLVALHAEPVRAGLLRQPGLGGLVTVITTALPASWSARISSGGGQPKVKLVTAGGSASRPRPCRRTRRRPSWRRRARGRASLGTWRAPGGPGTACRGTKTLTPKGSACRGPHGGDLGGHRRGRLVARG